MPGSAPNEQESPAQAGPKPRRVNLAVSAVAGASWMEVRAGNSPGSSSTAGRWSGGSARTSPDAGLQLALAAPDNLLVRVNGRRAELPAGHGVRRHGAQDRPRIALTRPRAAIVVTGSELVRGDREDRNGPFLASEALRLGLEPARIVIVGDRPDDLERALAEGLEADLASSPAVSARRTTTARSRWSRARPGRSCGSTSSSRRRSGRSRGWWRSGCGGRTRSSRPASASRRRVPRGRRPLGLAGTAPGLVLEAGSCAVVVLPGPPRELRRLWPRALESEILRRVLDRAHRDPSGRCCASSARPSRRSRRRSPRPGETATASRRRSARASSRSTSTSSWSRAGRSGRRRSPRPSGARSAATSSVRTSARSPRSCSTSAVRTGSRSRRRSRAPAASSPHA